MGRSSDVGAFARAGPGHAQMSPEPQPDFGLAMPVLCNAGSRACCRAFGLSHLPQQLAIGGLHIVAQQAVAYGLLVALPYLGSFLWQTQGGGASVRTGLLRSSALNSNHAACTDERRPGTSVFSDQESRRSVPHLSKDDIANLLNALQRDVADVPHAAHSRQPVAFQVS